MALRALPRMSLLSMLLPTAAQTTLTSTFPIRSVLFPAFAIPGIADIWDSVLKAVPKKKTSHMKKRHRQMAGKALRDVTALNECAACGRTKRAHILCPHCVAGIQRWFGTETRDAKRVGGASSADESGATQGSEPPR